MGQEIRNVITDSPLVGKYFNRKELLDLFPSARDSYSRVSLLWTVYAFHIWHDVFIDNVKEKIKRVSN